MSSATTSYHVGTTATTTDGTPNPVVQRYLQMVSSGSLQRDEQQWALVQELGRLYDAVCAHRAHMDEYNRATEEHQARRLKRLQELLAEERQQEQQREREEEERRRRQGGPAREPAAPGEHVGGGAASGLSGWGSWLRSAVAPLGLGAGGRSGSGGDPALPRARQAAASRESRLQREMGPPPVAPEPPKGMYVWGSVGSGKSMLVALFYQALAETAQLPASRWMHFNAAMLEVHSRLHHLDTERWRHRDERERLHRQQQERQEQQQQAGGLRRVDEGQSEHDHDEEEEEEEDDDDEEGASLPVSPGQQGVFLHWDPKKDPEVQRQREAKAAMLAVRRHMRLARLGRRDPRTLAAANAQGLVRMAASFIRGRAGDSLSGWGGGSGPIASLLYFDEVQVTDVFSAVALKGLVEALTAAGCVLVCTSNRAPGELPRHGLHEDMWGHFVDTLLQRCSVYELSSPADYRRVLLEQGRASIAAAGSAAGSTGGATRPWPPLSRSYLHPAGPASTAELEALWCARPGGPGSPQGQTGTERGQPLHVPVLFGRSLEVRCSSPCGGAAWFQFAELCGRPLGPADYVALSQRFHTVFLEGIPAMSMQVRDQARRFITLVDELYNARCVLVASAECPPEDLFTGAEGQEPILDLEGLQFETAVEGARLRRDATAVGGVAPVAATPASLALAMGALGGAEERFAFRRAVSRLLEMQSPVYITGALRMRQQQQQGQEL